MTRSELSHAVSNNEALQSFLADRVLVVDFGKPIALGEPNAVQRDPDVIRAYLGEEHRVATDQRTDDERSVGEPAAARPYDDQQARTPSSEQVVE